MDSGEQNVRRGYRLVPAIGLVCGSTVHYLLSEQKITATALRGMGHAKDLAYCLREVLSDPTAIFRGVREEGERNWCCYVGRPKHSYDRNGNTCPPRRDRVFLVFVNDEGVIYNWRWERCAEDDDGLPEGHDDRFNERVR